MSTAKKLLPMGRLRELRVQNKIRQKELAEDLEISQSTLCQYETGKRQPDYNTLKKFANYYNVSLDYLLEHSDIPNHKHLQKKPASSHNIKEHHIPVYKMKNIKLPLEAKHNVHSYEPLLQFRKSSFLAFSVNDNSMEPEYRKKDIIIVKKQERYRNGCEVVVLYNDSHLSVRKLILCHNEIILQPYNQNYPSEVIKDNTDHKVEIIGVVKELRRKKS